MKCLNCGYENNKNAKFCSRCGTALDHRATEKKSRGSKKIWILGTILLLGVMVGGIIALLNQKADDGGEYEKLVEQGNRYLLELDYENAEEMYLEALAIEPKKKEPYTKLAEIYMEQEEHEQAWNIAEKAIQELPEEEHEEFEQIIQQVQATTSEPEEDPLPQNLVTDAYTETYMDEYATYEWRIPKILLSSDDVLRINSEIWENVYMNGVQLNHEAIARKNPFLEKNEIEYDWAVNENILSLWIHTNVDQYSWDEYWVYNVDIMTGEEMSRESLLQAYGITTDEYYERAIQVLGSYYWSNWEQDNENFYNQNFVDWFNQGLNNTISKENINEAFPFINEQGELCLAAPVYSLAGAEYYWHILNMEKFDLLPYYSEEANLLK